MARLFFCFLVALWSACSASSAAENPALSPRGVARLITAAEKNVTDPRGWAADLLDVLKLHDLPASKENICASIAIIDQESSFVANPAVAGLGEISEKALRAKMDKVPVLGRLALRFLEIKPSPADNYLARIRAARTERDLDLVYRAMVTDAAKQSGLGRVINSGLLNRQIDGRNEIDTIGSMQVSVDFALEVAKQRRWLPMSLDDVYALRDELYTRHGGMYYGVLLLLGYETGYDRKLYRFADFNAGRYSSRNAAIQSQIAELSGNALATDGDLLLYDKSGKVGGGVSNTEKALRAVLKSSNFELTDEDIRKDLLREKDNDFVQTLTYSALRATYEQVTKKEPAFAMVPKIALSSPKIRSKMTTRIFAESVDRRYQSCMARK
ncbi:MAG TPA: DUF1615 family protein [Aestuariivirga sp.]|nr:DUF1615 family protein [Aestuariivirga sp.]